jgi:ATP-dependent Clp protease ATP-binding subunit ClpA
LLFGKLKKGGLVRVDIDLDDKEKLTFFFEPALPKPGKKSNAIKVDEEAEEDL